MGLLSTRRQRRASQRGPGVERQIGSMQASGSNNIVWIRKRKVPCFTSSLSSSFEQQHTYTHSTACCTWQHNTSLTGGVIVQSSCVNEQSNLTLQSWHQLPATQLQAGLATACGPTPTLNDPFPSPFPDATPPPASSPSPLAPAAAAAATAARSLPAAPPAAPAAAYQSSPAQLEPPGTAPPNTSCG